MKTVFLLLLIVTTSTEREILIPFRAATIERAEAACNRARLNSEIIQGRSGEFSAACVTK